MAVLGQNGASHNSSGTLTCKLFLWGYYFWVGAGWCLFHQSWDNWGQNLLQKDRQTNSLTPYTGCVRIFSSKLNLLPLYLLHLQGDKNLTPACTPTKPLIVLPAIHFYFFLQHIQSWNSPFRFLLEADWRIGRIVDTLLQRFQFGRFHLDISNPSFNGFQFLKKYLFMLFNVTGISMSPGS